MLYTSQPKTENNEKFFKHNNKHNLPWVNWIWENSRITDGVCSTLYSFKEVQFTNSQNSYDLVQNLNKNKKNPCMIHEILFQETNFVGIV